MMLRPRCLSQQLNRPCWLSAKDLQTCKASSSKNQSSLLFTA